MLSAFQKELMTKLKPKVEDPGEKDGVADDKETEEKEVEENEEPQKPSTQSKSTPDPSATTKSPENEGDKGDEDQLFNFDAVVANSRLSSQAAHHKMGVVRNAKQKRQRPARTRSVDATEPKKLEVSNLEISFDDESPATQDKTQDEETKEPSSLTPPPASAESIEDEEPEEPEEEERVTKGAEDTKSAARLTEDVHKPCAEVHGEAQATVQTPSENAASRIFTNAKTSISDVGRGSPTRPTQLEMAVSKRSEVSESPSPDTKKSPVTSPGNKKSPTSPGHVSVSLANRNQVDSQISTDVSPEGFPSNRRRSSIRDLARRFELDGNDDSKASPASKPSQGKSSASEEASKANQPGTKAANGDNTAVKSRVSGSPASSNVVTTSPRKLSQPVFTSPVAKTSPQRKASEPAIKKSVGASSIATRINKLTEKPAVSEKAIEVSRPRASTTSSINERANVFREGAKSTTEVRKLSVNAGERPRTKVMDMMKKFET